MGDQVSQDSGLTTLTGEQVRQFQAALSSAFTIDELHQLTFTRLDVELDNIVRPDAGLNVAYGLIMWAQRTGKLDALLDAAQQENPDNPEIKKLAAALRAPAQQLPHHEAGEQHVSSSVRQIKLKAFEGRLAALAEEYDAVNQQINTTIDEQVLVRLRRKAASIETEMISVERELETLKGLG